MSALKRYGFPIALSVLLLGGLVAGDTEVQTWLLALATLMGTLWLVGLGLRDRRELVSARLLLALGLLGLVVGPALLFAADSSLYAGEVKRPLGPGIAVFAVALPAMILGALAVRALSLPLPRRLVDRVASFHPRPDPPRARLVIVVLIPLAALAAFLSAAGGAAFYYANLDKTGVTTAGLTYFVWGVLVAKFAAFCLLAERWSSGRRAGPLLVAAVVVGLVFTAAIGTRLLLVVAAAELLGLFLLLRKPPGRRVAGTLAVTAAAGVVLVVGLGEFRKWQGDPEGQPFGQYLTDRGLPQLRSTYVNQYADSVRLAVIARDVVPREAPYEYGKELVRLVLQPVPGGVRPAVPRPEAVRQAFGSATGGNALPLPVIGFLQLGLFGIVISSVILGAVAGLVDRTLVRRADAGILLAALGAALGVVMVLRGSLLGSVAFATMDVVGFFVVHRFLFEPESWRSKASRVLRRTKAS